MVEQVVIAQSDVHFDGMYIFPSIAVDIGGLPLTPSKIGLPARLNISTSYFVLITWLIWNRFEAL
jgi:hypothetical protein